MDWLYNEFKQTGKDYASQEEVEIYDPSHDDFRNIRQEIAYAESWILPNPNASILDIGCGTGNFSIHFAKSFQKVYALDISPPMLSFARAKSNLLNLHNIDYIHGGYLNYKLPDNSIYGVISSLSLHHLPDFWKAKALDRIFLILKPAGKLYLHDVVIPNEFPEKAIQDFIDLQGERGGNFLREDTLIHFKEEFSTFDWIMQTMLINAGFHIQEVSTRDKVLKTYLCEKPPII
ncbi:class I SAM-dependent methyltransferase [Cyclobacterium jeungdonense]|uniref:Class I SAM-dependent methyltransferase n=1 Tax=Cyclobacterium jeungdonense TaxID=708087 RepID=A0ABT8CDL0_9BACT|nr:class I SAM-dependent methyltransferase [Cyclobacterium jeungdonense]MDN3689820.1 class I SAM-dependent methyltransferase [Cyclobacterium jeungdonense]